MLNLNLKKEERGSDKVKYTDIENKTVIIRSAREKNEGNRKIKVKGQTGVWGIEYDFGRN
jgi:hypothetical protein